jgi:hypothetical protein
MSSLRWGFSQAPRREEPCGSLNFVFERRRVIALELDDRRSIECLDEFAVLARSSSTNTRMFS